MNEEDDRKIVLEEFKLNIISPFINFYCDECHSSLEDRGGEPLIFGDTSDDSFPDRILCGKCAADYFKEEDYHAKQLREELQSIVVESEHTKRNALTPTIQKTAHNVLKSLSLGMSEKEILEKYPYLNRQDLLNCYEFAAQRI